MIDAVTVFEEDDPSEVISIIKPTIYVKGHDAVIDSNTPEMKILFATSALRLTSKENHVEFHSSEIVRKLNEDTSAS
jgi:bifunctional ADP-heptose synthase (sugar kinase/adenylyltransferase)